MRKKATTLLEVLVALFILAVLLVGLMPALSQMSQWENRISQGVAIEGELADLLARGQAGKGILSNGDGYTLRVEDFTDVPGIQLVAVTVDRPDDQVEVMTLRQVAS